MKFSRIVLAAALFLSLSTPVLANGYRSHTNYDDRRYYQPQYYQQQSYYPTYTYGMYQQPMWHYSYPVYNSYPTYPTYQQPYFNTYAPTAYGYTGNVYYYNY